MMQEYDWAAGATLLEDLPPHEDGSPQYRELIRGDLERCFDYARTMTVEGRRTLHIEIADGSRIEAIELGAFFGDAAEAPNPQKPVELPRP